MVGTRQTVWPSAAQPVLTASISSRLVQIFMTGLLSVCSCVARRKPVDKLQHRFISADICRALAEQIFHRSRHVTGLIGLAKIVNILGRIGKRKAQPADIALFKVRRNPSSTTDLPPPASSTWTNMSVSMPSARAAAAASANIAA